VKRTVISEPGAAIHMERIELPPYVQAAISESLERGRRDAMRARERSSVGAWVWAVAFLGWLMLAWMVVTP
jgi:hypothetical protein